MRVISPFGPKIAKLKFSSKLIDIINKEVDQISNKKKLLKKLDYSKKLVGQVKQELQLPRSFVKNYLEKVISLEVKKYIYKTLGKIKNSEEIKLEFREKEKKFDPEKVYKGQPNPTKL